MQQPKKIFLFVMAITAICLYFALPSTIPLPQISGINFPPFVNKQPIQFELFGKQVFYQPKIRQGLDLQGGTHLLLQANMTDISSDDRKDALDSAQEIIRRRIDAFGVAEPVIQTSVNPELNQYRLIVELPGVSDVTEAVSLIGQTALLDFREEDPDVSPDQATASAIAFLSSFKSTGLTGSQLKKANIQFDQETGEPVVSITFDDEGSKLFSEITSRNIGKSVAIFVDGFPVTIPTVQTAITNGEAIITGSFTTDSAKSLAIQLNSGALPVPIEVISQKNVGASLGQISVQKSIIAGIVGLCLVMSFIVLYYGWLGVIANLALIIYAIITLALYKILAITLTLPGLAGFILSVGMAVDSNILIFERFKEERRAKKPARIAMELAFGRAWDSIKDANVATLMICFILFNPLNWSFLNSSGMIRGFALTLALGIAISLFTGIVVTRTLIRLFYQEVAKKSGE